MSLFVKRSLEEAKRLDAFTIKLTAFNLLPLRLLLLVNNDIYLKVVQNRNASIVITTSITLFLHQNIIKQSYQRPSVWNTQNKTKSTGIIFEIMFKIKEKKRRKQKLGIFLFSNSGSSLVEYYPQRCSGAFEYLLIYSVMTSTDSFRRNDVCND
jgi:hypothetical protein